MWILDHVGSRPWQHGCWAAAGHVQITGLVHGSHRACAVFPVLLLPQPDVSSPDLPPGVACWNQPQKVKWSNNCHQSLNSVENSFIWFWLLHWFSFREVIWGACVVALSNVPRLLRMVLQGCLDLSDEELPHLGQILLMLLQHTPLHNQLMANAALLQEIIQHITVNAAALCVWLWGLDHLDSCYYQSIQIHNNVLK